MLRGSACNACSVLRKLIIAAEVAARFPEDLVAALADCPILLVHA